jgi:hypothetical protein
MSISMILPSATVKPMIVRGCQRTVITIPAVPFTGGSRARYAQECLPSTRRHG